MEIRVQDITKYIKGIECISEVSFSCRAGEIVGILAPRGSGKTLLLDLLRGKVEQDSGTVSFLVEDKEIPKNKILQYVGYLSSENALYQHMTVYDYLSFLAKFYHFPAYLRKERVRNLIKVCGLSRHKHRYLSELSKGQIQRIGLAQSLVHNPPFLLLDEPVKGLDPVQSEQLYELIKELGKDRSVLLTSSSMRDIETMCDTMLVFSNGKILAKGTVADLKQEVANSSILKVKIGGATDKVEVYQALQGIEYAQVVTSQNFSFDIHTTQEKRFAKDLFALCMQKGWYILRLVATEKSLEDIFKQLRRN
ncbi:MAG: ABC transporter ATP-binding protein [Flavobacteriaceae bacterium]|nr:ABC transporter ATP-binding protein [Flavobacteriaceae bacterium]